jgi:hypothetical protein
MNIRKYNKLCRQLIQAGELLELYRHEHFHVYYMSWRSQARLISQRERVEAYERKFDAFVA